MTASLVCKITSSHCSLIFRNVETFRRILSLRKNKIKILCLLSVCFQFFGKTIEKMKNLTPSNPLCIEHGTWKRKDWMKETPSSVAQKAVECRPLWKWHVMYHQWLCIFWNRMLVNGPHVWMSFFYGWQHGQFQINILHKCEYLNVCMCVFIFVSWHG